MRSLLIVVLLLSCARAYSGVSNPGSSCQAITPAQATRIEWREEGLSNTDTGTDWFVVCPFPRESGRSEQVFSMRAVNETAASIDLVCILRERRDGAVLQRLRLEGTVEGETAVSYQWTLTPEAHNSVVNAVCQLPAGIKLESLAWQYSGACQNADMAGLWQTTLVTQLGVEIDLLVFNENGLMEILMASTASDGPVEGRGKFVIDPEVCFVDADYSIGGRIAGSLFATLSRDKKILQGVFVTSDGALNSAVFSRVGSDTSAAFTEVDASSGLPLTGGTLLQRANQLGRMLKEQ